MPHTPEHHPALPTPEELAAMRTLLAGKRTFLAWCRTAMALMGFGFILEKMTFYLKKSAGMQMDRAIHEIGIIAGFAFCIGALIIILDGVRLIRSSRQFAAAGIKTSILPELVLILALGTIVIASILYGMDIFI